MADERTPVAPVVCVPAAMLRVLPVDPGVAPHSSTPERRVASRTRSDPAGEGRSGWGGPHRPGGSPQPRGEATRFRMTLAELEASAHVPTEDQVTTAAADRPPAGTDWERDRLDTRAAGGA